MKGLNKVQLIGYVGSDPKNSNGVTTFSIATSEKYVNKSGEKIENTEWHRITAFKNLAEISSSILKKGCLVYIEGKLHTGKWEDKNNVTHYSTEIRLQELNVLKFSDPSEKQEEEPIGTPLTYDNKNFDDDIPF